MFVSWFQHSFDMFYHTVLTWFDFEILWPMCISLYLNVKKWRTRVPQKYWHLICTNNYQQFPRMVFDFGFGSKLWVRIGTAQLLSQVYNQIKHVVRLRQIVERCNRPDQGHTYGFTSEVKVVCKHQQKQQDNAGYHAGDCSNHRSAAILDQGTIGGVIFGALPWRSGPGMLEMRRYWVSSNWFTIWLWLTVCHGKSPCY